MRPLFDVFERTCSCVGWFVVVWMGGRYKVDIVTVQTYLSLLSFCLGIEIFLKERDWFTFFVSVPSKTSTELLRMIEFTLFQLTWTVGDWT
jgi:hypothetical protein